MLKKSKKIYKKINLKKHSEKRAKNIVKRRVRGGFKLLYSVLRNLRYSEIGIGLKKKIKINTVYKKLKKNMQKFIVLKNFSQYFIISKTIKGWKRKIHSSGKFYKLKSSTLNQIKCLDRVKKKLVKHFGNKERRRRRKLKKIRPSRVYKNWLLLNQLALFSKIYSKKGQNKLQLKKTSKKKIANNTFVCF